MFVHRMATATISSNLAQRMKSLPKLSEALYILVFHLTLEHACWNALLCFLNTNKNPFLSVAECRGSAGSTIDQRRGRAGA
jgi:Na+/serine symporter